MPSKIQLDENLWFLYICLQKSDMKAIDFVAVGQATSLKPPAARMRYTRLRRQIESGTLIGTHGTPFATTSPPPTTTTIRKRKRLPSQPGAKPEARDEEDDAGFDVGGRRGSGSSVGGGKGKAKVNKRTRKPREEKAVVKEEQISDFESDRSSIYDSLSEDEMPLAKLRKTKIAATSSSTRTTSDADHSQVYGYNQHLGGIASQALEAEQVPVHRFRPEFSRAEFPGLRVGGYGMSGGIGHEIGEGRGGREVYGPSEMFEGRGWGGGEYDIGGGGFDGNLKTRGSV